MNVEPMGDDEIVLAGSPRDRELQALKRYKRSQELRGRMVWVSLVQTVALADGKYLGVLNCAKLVGHAWQLDMSGLRELPVARLPEAAFHFVAYMCRKGYGTEAKAVRPGWLKEDWIVPFEGQG